MTRNSEIYRFREQSAQDLTDTQQLEMNFSLALNANPWLGQAPQTLMQLATSGMDPELLVTQAGAMSGMQHLDELRTSLDTMTPSGQRALYGKLTEQQQRGLAQMGFAPPGDPADPGFVGGILGAAATVAAPVFGVVSAPVRAVAGIPIPGTDTNLFSGALNVMTWIGDVPGHMYRTIRQMEGWQQWVALGVGVAAAAALPFAAPALMAAVAGMGTLATVGTVAGAGLAAGFASTALTSQMVTSPTEWWDIANPFGTTGVMRGERIFNAESKEEARRILGGVPHLDAMARDVAANLDVYDLVEDFAGRRDAGNVNVMTAALEKVAAGMADPGTAEYMQIFNGLSVLVEQPEFREAIDTLEGGKISFGRDVASSVGLQKGEFGQGMVSGVADALMILAVDPFLLLGTVGKVRRIGRHGIPIPDADDALNRVSEMIQRDDRLGATVDQVMSAVINRDFRSMPKQWRGMYDDLSDWNRGKEASGGAFETREHFIEWLVEGTKMRKVLEGKATIQGQERLIFNTANRSQGFGKFSQVVRQVTAGLDDAQLDKYLRQNAKNLGVEEELGTILPEMWQNIPVESAWTKIDAAAVGHDIRTTFSYKTGKAVGEALVRVPGGAPAIALMNNVFTMIPPGSGIALIGEGSEDDIVRFVQTFGRHFNMPSYARDQWLNTVMHQGSVGQRRAALNSFMDSGFTAAGMRTTDTLSAQVDAILGKVDQAYALGGYDALPLHTLDSMSIGDAAGILDFQRSINRVVGILPTQHQAVYMVVPNLRDMAKMVYNGRVLKHVARLTDADLATQAMSRFIKPGWLLRIGFIPRAAGEEALAWIMRVSEGGIMQEFGARSLGARQAFRDARTALETVGRKNMTPEQIRALDFQVAQHLRPLANMMRRNGSLLPDDHMLVRWSDFMRDTLERGLDVPWGRVPDEVKQLRNMDLTGLPATQRKLALYEMKDAILFGKEHSIRRMMLNGVDPELTEAAALWVMRHSDAVMKSTSSMNASLFERDIVNPDKEVQHIPNARELGQPDNRLVLVTGERTRVAPNDIYFDTATHHQIGQIFADEVVGPIFSEEVLKYFDQQNLGFFTMDNMHEALTAQRQVQSKSGQRLIDELLSVRDDDVAAQIQVLSEIAEDTGNEVVQMVSTAADRARIRGEFTVEGLLRQLRNIDEEVAADPKYIIDVPDFDEPGPLPPMMMIPNTKKIQAELETMQPIIEGLDALTPSGRQNVVAMLTMDSKREGGFYDLAALQRHASGERAIYAEPRMKMWRGVKDQYTLELLPDGNGGVTLRMHGVPQAEWNSANNISTTIDPYQAIAYAIHPQAYSGRSTRGFGAVVEFDGEYALDQMSTTWDDVSANPILYSNADTGRGRGAYLIGSGSVDESEVAFYMGPRPQTLADDFTPEQLEAVKRMRAILGSDERHELMMLDDEINSLAARQRFLKQQYLDSLPEDDPYHLIDHGDEEQQYQWGEYDDGPPSPNDYDDEFDPNDPFGFIEHGIEDLVLPGSGWKRKRPNLQYQVPKDWDLAQVTNEHAEAIKRWNVASKAYDDKYKVDVDELIQVTNQMRNDLPPFGGSNQAENTLMIAQYLDDTASFDRDELLKLDEYINDTFAPENPQYIDIPHGKWKIYNSDEMKHWQEQSLTSNSRFADKMHSARFETEWGQPIDEFWGDTIAELDEILAQIDPDALVDMMDDFTFTSIRNMTGAGARQIMEAGISRTPDEGFVRLYRGVSPSPNMTAEESEALHRMVRQPHDEDLLMFTESAKARKAMGDVWFTTDRRTALRHPTNRNTYEGNVVDYVDIPQAEYDRLVGLADQPDEIRALAMGEDEVILPPELIAKAQPLTQYKVDPRITDWLTRATEDADFPTELEAIMGEAAAGHEDLLDFWRHLDDYVRTGGQPDQFNNRWKALKESFDLRGRGDLTPEELAVVGQGWSPFYDNVDDLKAGIQYRLSQELMRPENQQYTKLSDQVLRTTDGSATQRPLDGGLSRLYTPVVPQNLIPDIAAGLETELQGFFSNSYSPDMVESIMTIVTGVNGSTATTATIPELWHHLDYFQAYGSQGPKLPFTKMANDLVAKWRSRASDPSWATWGAADEIQEFRDDLAKLGAITMAPITENVAKKIVAAQDLRRVNDPFIQAMPAEDREAILEVAILRLIRDGLGPQPAARPLGGVAFGDPRIARYVTNSLSGMPFDDSIKHMQIGMVDVPRQAVIGDPGKWVEGVAGSPMKGGEWAYTLDNQYTPKIEISDAAHIRESTDGLTPLASWEQAINEWSGRIHNATWGTTTRGNREIAKLKPADQLHGARIGRRSGNRVIEVQPGEEFVVAEDLFLLDEQGRVGEPLEGMSNQYFDRVPIEGNDELMWNIIGPMIRDREEQAAGFSRIIPRNLENKRSMLNRMQPTLAIDQSANVDQWQVLTRSRVNDVALEPAGALPNIQIAAQYKQLPNNMWDRFVRWGFDSVIGPSVDALVRKPMSFHYFAGAYKQNKAYLGWMLDDDLFKNRIPKFFQRELDVMTDDAKLLPSEINGVRQLAHLVYDENLAGMSDEAVLQWLITLGPDDATWSKTLTKGADTLISQVTRDVQKELDAMEAAGTLTEKRHIVFDRMKYDHPLMADAQSLNSLATFKDRSQFMWSIDGKGLTGTPAQKFVHAYHDAVPPNMWSKTDQEIGDWLEVNAPHLPNTLQDKQWRVLRQAQRNLAMTLTDLNDIATLRAINNITPFLDSHEQRSMFAEYGRNFIPFWYAEENFMKRWGRTLAMDGLSGGLKTIRKAQLMYAGIKSGGVIRTDVNGKDWFVYPGSGLLSEAISAIWPGKEQLPIGVLMQASTDSLLPGINDQFGQANFSPLVAVSLNATLQLFPETQDLRRSLMGDVAINRNVVKQFVPGVLSNLWDVAFADENSSTKYSSAMMTAIAFAEANDQGLPESATAVQADEYLDRIRNHARIILLTQALTGYVVPGAPSAVATNEDMGSFGWLSGVGVDDPRQITTQMYRTYIQNLGVDEGTAAFLRAFPTADLEDIVNPLAFSVSGSQSVSGAQLPATQIGMKWYTDNQKWVDGMPEAGAWFLPPDETDAEFDYYSYSQQLASGLRKKKTPVEFLRSIKYRQGADVYFANKDIYDAGILKVGDNSAAKKEIDARWALWKSEFEAAHPIFAEELQSGEARERRARTIQQMRDAIGDPLAPPSPHTEGISELVNAYDMFTNARIKFSAKRDELSRRKVAKLKERFSAWVVDWQLRYPQLQRLWSSVYEPEARLD